MEPLKNSGFEALGEAVIMLMNGAMIAKRSEHLGIQLYERSGKRTGYANGFKDKTIRTRLGELSLRILQTRNCDFYPHSLERGLRSERAMIVPIAEMYVQGVATRRVKQTVEELCGMEVSSTQVSRVAASLDELLHAWRTRDLCAYPYAILIARVGLT